MKVLASAVLTMEALTMGFALLLVAKEHSSVALYIGGAIAILLIFSVYGIPTVYCLRPTRGETTKTLRF